GRSAGSAALAAASAAPPPRPKKRHTTWVTCETRALRRPGSESPEQALNELGEWLKVEEGRWVQRSAIVEVRVETDDDELEEMAAELERPLSDQEQAALAGEGNL